MNIKQEMRFLCLLLSCLLLVLVQPSRVQAVEPAGKFVLVAEAGGKLVFAPEYVSYTEGQTIGEALENSDPLPYPLQNSIIYYAGPVDNDDSGLHFWAVGTEDVSMLDYILAYYKANFEDDSHVHYIVNIPAGLTYEISPGTKDLQVVISTHRDGDELDLDLLGKGEVMGIYSIDRETGEISRFS